MRPLQRRIVAGSENVEPRLLIFGPLELLILMGSVWMWSRKVISSKPANRLKSRESMAIGLSFGCATNSLKGGSPNGH